MADHDSAREVVVIKLEEWVDVVALHRQGLSIRAIARRLGISRNAVRRALRRGGPPVYLRPPRPSKLDPFKDYLLQRLAEFPELSAAALFDEIKASMGSRGDAYDNAAAESMMATIKTELVHRRRFKTQDEARLALFRYIEGFYNPLRRHSALGYKSPAEYERMFEEAPLEAAG